MLRTLKTLSAGAIALAMGLSVSSFDARAQTAAEFYKGKTLTYIIATKPGGGYDTYGRLTAKYMGKHLGAKIIVKNMPGAGHIIGANHIFKAKPDGITFGMFNTGLIHAQILGREGVQFDLTKMSWIGKAAADPRVLIVGKETGITSIDGLRGGGDPILFGASGVGSASYNDTKLLVTALGLNVKLIPGFSGNEAEMSMLRNEISGTLGSYSSLRPFVDNGYGTILFHIGGQGGVFSNLPAASDLAVNADGKSLISLIASQVVLARFTAGPPGIPKDRLAALRDAYKLAMTDPGLLAEASKLNIPIIPAYGDDVAERVAAALNQPESVVTLFKSVMLAKAPTAKTETELLTVEDGGKQITFMSGGTVVASKVSGSRSKVMINGKESDRGGLQPGMKCTIEYKPGGKNEPVLMDCRGGSGQAAADPETVMVETALLAVGKDGKKITFEANGETIKSKVSGKRTKITIGGEEAERGALMTGMACMIAYTPGDNNEPKTLDCQAAPVSVETTLSSVEDGGKVITFTANGETVKSKVSGKRSMITIAGAESGRKMLEAGMNCRIEYQPGGKNEPKSLDCD